MVVVGYLIVARNTFTIRLPNYARLLVHKIGYIFFNQNVKDEKLLNDFCGPFCLSL